MNKILKAAQTRGVRFGAVAMSLGLGALNSAHAAIDITAATADAKSDITTAGALIVGVVVAVAAISWVRRVIK